MEYRGDLYVGTFVQAPWFDGISGIEPPVEEGGRLYRIDSAENIVELVGPNGLLMGSGFDNPQNYGIRSMAVFQGKLYLGTAQTFIWGEREGAEVWELNPDASGCDL